MSAPELWPHVPAPQLGTAPGLRAVPQRPCCRSQISGCAAIKRERPWPLCCVFWGSGKAGSAPFLWFGFCTTHPCILQSILSVHLSICHPPSPPFSICTFIRASCMVHLSSQPSIHPHVIHPLSHLPIHQLVHIHLSVHPCFHSSIHPDIY